ncbi:Tyrosine recombinase XerC [bioreactor metagenome]|uniref:Tyrosine recombinase XerC n=1 Tax=bioreactor metagenome TaxID=1076179 RepID=A0A644WQV0_9ZZZZ
MAKTKKKATRRSPGEGTIYQMKDGRYGAAVSLGKDENGKRIRPIITGVSEDDVREKMKNLLQEMKAVDNNEPVIINSLTSVEDFIKEFKLKSLLNKPEISSRTYENYEYSLNHFENAYRGKPIGSMDTAELNSFFRGMENTLTGIGVFKYSQASLDRLEYILERMYRRGMKKGYISLNPFDDEDYSKPKSKQEKKEVLALTKDECEAMVAVLQENKLIYPVIGFMLNTGTRTQEALGLKWKHIDWDNGIIQIRQAITIEVTYDKNGNKLGRETVSSTTKKGSGDRDIYISEGMINALTVWKTEAPEISKTAFGEEDYVFGNSKCGHWTYSGFRSSVNRYLERNIKDTDGLCLHRIRHTVATSLAEDGASVVELMQLLGHTQTKTTMKYIDKASKKIAENNRERLGRCLSERLA